MSYFEENSLPWWSISNFDPRFFGGLTRFQLHSFITGWCTNSTSCLEVKSWMSLQILEDKLVFLIVSQNSDTPHTCVSALCEIPQSLLCKISHYTTIPDVLVFFEDILIKVNYRDNGCCASVVIKLQYTIRKRCSNRKAPRNKKNELASCLWGRLLFCVAQHHSDLR